MLDVATDKLLDFEDSVKVVVERNWNFEDNQLDNRPSETNNNLSWVRLSEYLKTLSYPLTVLMIENMVLMKTKAKISK